MSKKYDKCSYPNCDGVHNPTVSGNIPLCARHYDLMKFFLWALENVKIPNKEADQKTSSGIILPK